MIRINLIPYRIARRQQQIIQHSTVFFGIVIIAVLLALAAHTVSSLQLSELKEQTLSLQKQNADLKKKIGKLHNLGSLRADVERKLQIVDRLQEGRFHSLRTLHEVARVIPENVWINSVSNSDANITLTGLAESNKAVASFMRKLDSSPLFDNVQLMVISRVMENGLPVRSFNLKLKRVDKSAEVKESKKSRAGKS